MIPEFTAPSFINENDADTIQERMMSELPADIDNMPGGFPWDFTRPTANEKAELVQYHLTQTLQLMFPMWSWGDFLNYHASITGVKRREAAYASGYLIIEGKEGTEIPVGSVFVTPATDNPSIEFETLKDAEIGDDGRIEVEIRAVEPGPESNVAAGTITLMAKTIKGVTGVCNTLPITGGTEEEDDESVRERIQEINEALDVSFVGSDSDYIRWAKQVPGVGNAVVIPEFDGPGTVKVVIWDANAQPASDQLLDAVREHILCPDNRMERKAPIGAQVTIEKPKEKLIHYSFILTLDFKAEKELTLKAFKDDLLKYYAQAKNEKVLKYNNVAALLTNTRGVKDFSDLKLNGDIRNIPLAEDEYPVTGRVEASDPEEEG